VDGVDEEEKVVPFLRFPGFLKVILYYVTSSILKYNPLKMHCDVVSI